jgi:hypothetical protein
MGVAFLPGIIGKRISIEFIDGDSISGEYSYFDEKYKVLGISVGANTYYIPISSIKYIKPLK